MKYRYTIKWAMPTCNEIHTVEADGFSYGTEGYCRFNGPDNVFVACFPISFTAITKRETLQQHTPAKPVISDLPF